MFTARRRLRPATQRRSAADPRPRPLSVAERRDAPRNTGRQAQAEGRVLGRSGRGKLAKDVATAIGALRVMLDGQTSVAVIGGNGPKPTRSAPRSWPERAMP
jgi:hypothetical protein